MNVKLIDYTKDALELLIYTKNTRLMGGSTLEEIKQWSQEKKIEHLEYMRDTIQSSWEFINFTFEISGVTRAFTHQFVRTRTGKYAQESQRTVDVSDVDILGPDHESFRSAGDVAMYAYKFMIEDGIPIQDARAILPVGTTTSIIAQFDLRTLHNMGLLRLCTRTQGEYQRVFKEMMALVVDTYPWADQFIKVHCAWYGTCAFPRYDKCPIKQHTMTVLPQYKTFIENKWKEIEHEANPIAKDGKTM